MSKKRRSIFDIPESHSEELCNVLIPSEHSDRVPAILAALLDHLNITVICTDHGYESYDFKIKQSDWPDYSDTLKEVLEKGT